MHCVFVDLEKVYDGCQEKRSMCTESREKVEASLERWGYSLETEYVRE